MTTNRNISRENKNERSGVFDEKKKFPSLFFLRRIDPLIFSNLYKQKKISKKKNIPVRIVVLVLQNSLLLFTTRDQISQGAARVEK